MMADGTPDVTVAITCHQQAALVGEAIRSALDQTVPCRVLVVDDGSTDGSVEAAEATGVTVLRLPYGGALTAFRAAADAVGTPFHCLLNADDALEPTYVERTRPVLDDPRVGFVYTAVRLTGAGEGRVLPAPPFDLRTLRWGNYVHGASLVRTAAYRSAGGYDERFADHHEDWALWIAMARAGWLGVPVDEALLRYRREREAGRNPSDRRAVEDARWRLFRRDPGLYGAAGFVRLVASSARMALTGR